MMIRRSISALAVLAALVALPAAAQAATPPTVTVSPASVAKSYPVFTWANGPAGEFINYVYVEPTGVKSPNEEPQTIRGLAGANTATTFGALDAGTYSFYAGWSTASGVTPYETGTTAPQSITIKPVVKTLTFRGIDQFRDRPYLTLRGRYTTNIPFPTVACKVFNGRKLVGSDVMKKEDANTITFTSDYVCNGLRVPESLDGTKLRAEVTVFLGATKKTISKTFIAK